MLLMLVTPLLGWAAYKAAVGSSTDILEWLPQTSVEVSSLGWFDEHFGTDQVLVIAWEGGHLEDPRVDAVAKSIRKLQTKQGEPLFDRVVSGPQTMRYIAGPLHAGRDEAIARLSGWLSGQQEATAVVAIISSVGMTNASAALELVRNLSIDLTGLKGNQIRIAGTTADVVAVEAASIERMVELGTAAISVALLMAIFAMGGFLQALPVLISAFTTSLSSLTAMYLMRLPVDGLSVMVPVLGFVLTASVTLHLDGYRRRHRDRTSDLSRAIIIGSLPTAVALSTTFLGFAALLFSETVPIQRFAIASAVTVIIVALVSGLVWPALVLALRVPRQSVKKSISAVKWSVQVVSMSPRLLVGIVLLSGIAMTGLPGLDAAFGIDRLLRENHPLVEDYRWFESNIGNVVPVEIVVRFKNRNGNSNLSFFATSQGHRGCETGNQ